VRLENLGDDEAGVTVSQTALTVFENGGTATYTVVLTRQPAGDVTVILRSSNTDAATVPPSSLIFGSDNWDTPQEVTVTGVNDDVAGGARQAVISHRVTGGGHETNDTEAVIVRVTVTG